VAGDFHVLVAELFPGHGCHTLPILADLEWRATGASEAAIGEAFAGGAGRSSFAQFFPEITLPADLPASPEPSQADAFPLPDLLTSPVRPRVPPEFVEAIRDRLTLPRNRG
jgi:hypothetical protein